MCYAHFQYEKIKEKEYFKMSSSIGAKLVQGADLVKWATVHGRKRGCKSLK